MSPDRPLRRQFCACIVMPIIGVVVATALVGAAPRGRVSWRKAR